MTQEEVEDLVLKLNKIEVRADLSLLLTVAYTVS